MRIWTAARVSVLAAAMVFAVAGCAARQDANTPREAEDPEKAQVPLPHLGVGGTVTASSTRSGPGGYGPPACLVDGDPATRWSSAYADNQEVSIDLGSVKPVARLQLMWAAEAAHVYSIQVSPDGSIWSVPITTTSGVQGPRIDEIPIKAPVRFIRIGLRSRLTQAGFALYEVVIMDH